MSRRVDQAAQPGEKDPDGHRWGLETRFLRKEAVLFKLAVPLALALVLSIWTCGDNPQNRSSSGKTGEENIRPQSQPNIIFFLTDDQAYDTIGAYGNPDVKTPAMDALASEGVVFDRFYVTTAICMASRATVMTGMYEYKTGCNFMHGPMGRDKWQLSYPVLLRKAGYRTAFGGKFGFAVMDDPASGGSEGDYANLPVSDFDFWVGGTGQTSYETHKNKYLAKYADEFPHSTRAYGAAGRDFIRESVQSGKPFCLTLFFKAPHRPTTPDPVFDDIYANSTFRKLPNYGRKAGEHLAPQSRMGRQYPRFISWGYHTDKTYQAVLRTYNQQIYGVDYAIGMIMSELESLGLAGNTVVILSSDNGFFNGSHGFGSKVLPYEESTRVPLIIRDPRIGNQNTNRHSKALAGNVDIPATILDLAGVDIPANMDGRSLLPILYQDSNQVRETLPLIQAWGPAATHSLGVVTRTHKYVYWMYGEEMTPVEEIFDLENDPFEMVNLASDEGSAETLEILRRLYDAELSKWKTETVIYNDYKVFGSLFDRKIPWQEKHNLIPKQFRP
jgi:arylsulfatase A-like enzyme